MNFDTLADELNQCLQIIITNAGNLEQCYETLTIESAVGRAAKAILDYRKAYPNV